MHGSIRAICGLIDRELVVVAAFREFLIGAVVSLNRKAISSLLQRLIHLERCAIDTFVDVRRCDLVILGIEREFVVGRIRIRIPLQFQILLRSQLNLPSDRLASDRL